MEVVLFQSSERRYVPCTDDGLSEGARVWQVTAKCAADKKVIASHTHIYRQRYMCTHTHTCTRASAAPAQTTGVLRVISGMAACPL